MPLIRTCSDPNNEALNIMETDTASAPGPIAHIIERLFFHIAGLCLFVLFIVMMGGVIFRYLPVQSELEHWVPGLLNLLQVWLILFGSLAAVISRHHLRIGFIIERLPRKINRLVEALVWVVRFATLALLLYASGPVIKAGFDASIGGVPFTMGVVYIALPIVLPLMILLELINAKQAFSGKGGCGQ